MPIEDRIDLYRRYRENTQDRWDSSSVDDVDRALFSKFWNLDERYFTEYAEPTFHRKGAYMDKWDAFVGDKIDVTSPLLEPLRRKFFHNILAVSDITQNLSRSSGEVWGAIYRMYRHRNTPGEPTVRVQDDSSELAEYVQRFEQAFDPAVEESGKLLDEMEDCLRAIEDANLPRLDTPSTLNALEGIGWILFEEKGWIKPKKKEQDPDLVDEDEREKDSKESKKADTNPAKVEEEKNVA